MYHNKHGVTIAKNEAFEAIMKLSKVGEDELSKNILSTLEEYYGFSITPSELFDDEPNVLGFDFEEGDINPYEFVTEVFGEYGDEGHNIVPLMKEIEIYAINDEHICFPVEELMPDSLSSQGNSFGGVF